MISSRIINQGVVLFRYDVKEPPIGTWSVNFKSPIYVIEDEYFGNYTTRPKNAIGAFFFFDKENDAIDVGKNILIQKMSSIILDNPSLSLWITRTSVKEDIRLLDLTACDGLVDLYASLYMLDIDIFRNDFYKITIMDNEPLSHIKDDVAYIAENDSFPKSLEQLECESRVANLYNTVDENDQLCFACQQLTDFENGFIFKNILQDKGFDGYMFHEAESTTFCIFQSNKLSEPNPYKIANVFCIK